MRRKCAPICSALRTWTLLRRGDAGMVSDENLQELARSSGKYIVAILAGPHQQVCTRCAHPLAIARPTANRDGPLSLDTGVAVL